MCGFFYYYLVMNIFNIIEKYYDKDSNLYNLLIKHSKQVVDLALLIANKNPQLKIDADFTFEASMLHDIGIFKTHAPSIYCIGDKPYICHGYLGREILEAEGLPQHALVCEHHTGSGITANEIITQNLPLPHRDMLPTSIEEKLVCYADKFFSKSHIAPAKPLEQVRKDMSKFGEESLKRFDDLTKLFGTF